MVTQEVERVEQVDAPIKWLRVKDIAARLDVSAQSAYLLLWNGDIKSTRVGRSYRIDPRDLQAYIDEHTTTDPMNRRGQAPGQLPLPVGEEWPLDNG